MMATQEVRQSVSYFKRFRMELDLRSTRFPDPELPSGYCFVPWDDGLIEMHAETKASCFAEEIDAIVFPSLGSRTGCQRLMREIRGKPGFLPEATWLVGCGQGLCGTVQGIRDRSGVGAIQNLGVVPTHRGMGLGSALLLKALEGFRAAGLERAQLEVTAQNDSAVRLYRRIGFRCRKSLYKAVDAFSALGEPIGSPGSFLSEFFSKRS